jgi:putative peptidoglycan lipid II flippase
MAGMTSEVTSEAESTARSSATVAIWTLLSRGTGMLRVLVIGAMLGPTYFANLFQAGYVLPNTVFAVVAGPVLGMVVVPAVARSVTLGGVDRAADVFSRIAGRLLAMGTVGMLGLALISPLLAWSLVFDFPPAERHRAWVLCTVLILFVAPQVLLYTVTQLGVAAQQGRHRFALAAGAPAVESLGTIATLAVAAWLYGTGHEVSQIPMSMVVLLGVGTTGSVVVHAGLQAWGAMRVGVPIKPKRGWKDDQEARGTLHRMVRSIPVAGGPALVDYGLTVVASTVPGGVLVVQLSYQVFAALSFVGSRAVSMAALPGLAEAVAAEDRARFGAAWRQGVFYALAAGLPLMMLLGVFSGPTSDLLANGALRQGPLIAELSTCLVVSAIAQLANGVHDYSRQALFARLDDQGPARASIVGVIASAVVAAGALLMPAGDGRLTWLVIALLAGEIASAVYALLRVRAAITPESMMDHRHTLTLVLAVVSMVPVLVAARWLIASWHPQRLVELPLLVGAGILAVAPFGLVLWLRGLGGSGGPHPDPAADRPDPAADRPDPAAGRSDQAADRRAEAALEGRAESVAEAVSDAVLGGGPDSAGAVNGSPGLAGADGRADSTATGEARPGRS